MLRSISVLTGAVQSISDDGWEVQMSPDGKQIVYVDGQFREIRIAGSGGESPRALFRTPDDELVASVHWLQGGKRIGYLRGKAGAEEAWIATRDVAGGEERRAIEAPTESIAFTPDSKVFYTTKGAWPQQVVSLWMLALDPVTGAAVGSPKKIAVWPGVVAAEPITVSADGRRLALTKIFSQSDVYLIALDGSRPPRQLTSDTQVDWPSAWIADGSSFLFFSNRGGALQGFRQPLANEAPASLIVSRSNVRAPQMSPDGKWIVYVEMDAQPEAARVMRLAVSGGPPVRVLDVTSQAETATLQYWAAGPGTTGTGARAFPDIRCPPRGDGSCILAESRADPKTRDAHVVLSAFDVITGSIHEIARLDDGLAGLTFWDVSPDGRTIVSGVFGWGSGDRLTFLDLSTRMRRAVPIQGFKNVADIAWAADGRSLIATTNTIRGGEVLRVGLDGAAQLVQWFESQVLANPRPSPDGRSLLLGVLRSNSNAWVLDR